MTAIRALCIEFSLALTSCTIATVNQDPNWPLAPPEIYFTGLRVTGLSYPGPTNGRPAKPP